MSSVLTYGNNVLLYQQNQQTMDLSNYYTTAQTYSKTEVDNLLTGITFSSSINVGITIDGGGNTLSTGSKGFRLFEFGGTVEHWSVIGNAAGNIQFDILKNGVSIIGTGNKPILSSTQRADEIVSGWTSNTVTIGDEWEFYVDTTSVITRVNLFITILKT